MNSIVTRDWQGAILVYDVSSRESFNKVEDWLTELETYSTNHDLIKMLVMLYNYVMMVVRMFLPPRWVTSATRRARGW